MAAVTGRRKQLKSQQLQPVAAAANIATADRTNSFLIISLLSNNGSRRDRWVRMARFCGSPASKSVNQCGSNQTPIGRWAEQLYTAIGVVQTPRAYFWQQTGGKYAACSARDERGRIDQVWGI
jgi:hypothetical protein